MLLMASMLAFYSRHWYQHHNDANAIIEYIIIPSLPIIYLFIAH